jgi:hypothetical protein
MKKSLIPVLIALFLAGCGGGGGNSPSSPPRATSDPIGYGVNYNADKFITVGIEHISDRNLQGYKLFAKNGDDKTKWLQIGRANKAPSFIGGNGVIYFDPYNLQVNVIYPLALYDSKGDEVPMTLQNGAPSTFHWSP